MHTQGTLMTGHFQSAQLLSLTPLNLKHYEPAFHALHQSSTQGTSHYTFILPSFLKVHWYKMG